MFKTNDKVIYKNDGEVPKGSVGIIHDAFEDIDQYIVQFADGVAVCTENQMVLAGFEKGDRVEVIAPIPGIATEQCLGRVGTVVMEEPNLSIRLTCLDGYARFLVTPASSLKKIESKSKGSRWWV